MEFFLFALFIVGAILSFKLSLIYQGVILACFLLFFLTKTFRDAEIGQIFIVLYMLSVFVGFGVGNIVYYFSTDISFSKDYSSLPELNCKSSENNFILKEYSISDNKIINLKTDQVFLKKDCFLK